MCVGRSLIRGVIKDVIKGFIRGLIRCVIMGVLRGLIRGVFRGLIVGSSRGTKYVHGWKRDSSDVIITILFFFSAVVMTRIMTDDLVMRSTDREHLPCTSGHKERAPNLLSNSLQFNSLQCKFGGDFRALLQISLPHFPLYTTQYACHTYTPTYVTPTQAVWVSPDDLHFGIFAVH